MSGPHDIFAGCLVSDGPSPDLPAHARIFAPFVGSWDLVVSWFDDSGGLSRREEGEWHFAWVLEGRAIQDVWIVPPRTAPAAGRDLYEYGTSIRIYDPAIDAWRSTWIGPMHGAVRSFIARRIGEAVVLETTEGASPRMRWSFVDIAEDRFNWRNELWTSAGWRLQQSFAARRRLAARVT
jgi:hypothetical protein